MSSGDSKAKASSQTDGKAAQGKKSEMGMMSYRVGGFFTWFSRRKQSDIHQSTHTLWIISNTFFSAFAPSLDVCVRSGEFPGPHD